MIAYPWLAMFLTLLLCLVWMRSINFLASKQFFETTISRKLIHIGTGPIFVLCWLLFPEDAASKYYAAAVPFLIVLQMAIVGLGMMKDYGAVKSMARSGENKELLRGPLFYGVVFVLLTIFFWKSSHAIIALMILCGGDGAADLLGSRIKSCPIPWAKKKTIMGSLAMFVVGTVLALVMIFLVIVIPQGGQNLSQYVIPVIVISMIATLVETITPSDYDNLTVPVISLIMSLILL